jgi:hypothetical protein
MTRCADSCSYIMKVRTKRSRPVYRRFRNGRLHFGHLRKRGQMIGANDLFIAAHARSLGLRLVTNNTAEFGRVKGVTVENWTRPPVVLVRYLQGVDRDELPPASN